jgi:hypothetical protein
MRLDPKYAMPHNYLELALKSKGDLDGAITGRVRRISRSTSAMEVSSAWNVYWSAAR